MKTKISVCFNNIIATMKQKYVSTYQEKAKKRLITLHRGDLMETVHSLHTSRLIWSVAVPCIKSQLDGAILPISIGTP